MIDIEFTVQGRNAAELSAEALKVAETFFDTVTGLAFHRATKVEFVDRRIGGSSYGLWEVEVVASGDYSWSP